MGSIVKTAFCLLLLASLQSVTECFSGGAPVGACTGVSPDPTRHGAQPQMTDVPYVLTGLPPANYTPGMSYTCEFNLVLLAYHPSRASPRARSTRASRLPGKIDSMDE